jgi:hypothetical protein
MTNDISKKNNTIVKLAKKIATRIWQDLNFRWKNNDGIEYFQNI